MPERDGRLDGQGRGHHRRGARHGRGDGAALRRRTVRTVMLVDRRDDAGAELAEALDPIGASAVYTSA